MTERGPRDGLAPEHTGHLTHARVTVERPHGDSGPPRPHAFRNPHVVVGAGRDSGEMGHAQDLAPVGHRRQLLGDHGSHSSPDAGIDLVEDHGPGLVGAGEDGRESEHRACELAA